MRLTACNSRDNSLVQSLKREEAKANLAKVVEASSHGNNYEDVFPALFMVARQSKDVLSTEDVRETLSKIAAKGVHVEDQDFQAEVIVRSAGIGDWVPQPLKDFGTGIAGGVGAIKDMGSRFMENVSQGAKGAKAKEAMNQAVKALNNLLALDPSSAAVIKPTLDKLMQQTAQQAAPQQAAPKAAPQQAAAPAAQPAQAEVAGQPGTGVVKLKEIADQNKNNPQFIKDIQELISKYSPKPQAPAAAVAPQVAGKPRGGVIDPARQAVAPQPLLPLPATNA
jgi:hypothetical protein